MQQLVEHFNIGLQFAFVQSYRDEIGICKRKMMSWQPKPNKSIRKSPPRRFNRLG